jgi:hypothetical protein
MPRPCLDRVGALAAVLLLAAGPSVGRAQAASRDAAPEPRLRLSVGGGFAENPPFRPAGVSALGYGANAAVEWRARRAAPWSALRLRADGLVAHWGAEQHLAALTAGVVARGPERWRVAPHVMAGAGGYRASRSAEIDPGWTLGAGVRVPLGGAAFLLESRMHAFRVNSRELAAVGVSPFDLAYARWQYTATPLTFSVQF